MLKRLIAPLFFFLLAAPVQAQVACPNPFVAGAICVPITASAVGTTAAITATIPAVIYKTAYICGFNFSGTNATAANPTANLTITGTIGGTMNFGFPTLAAGAAVQNNPPIGGRFNPCIAANAINTSIVVNGPAIGAGATRTTLSAWGYYL